jgi:Domain of unknown function (DUF6285)
MPAGFPAMPDLPAGPALLALARDVLLNDLMPLLPPESRLDLRLIANSMAIAEREAAAREGPIQDIARELRIFYQSTTLARPAVQAASILSRDAERGAECSEAGESQRRLLARFARDLRAGEFEASRQHDRRAREILWRLTVLKLRQANPRFLTANGLG